MILNTGGRTDTVQYYSEWLLNRFREGYVLSRNPLFPEIVNPTSIYKKSHPPGWLHLYQNNLIPTLAYISVMLGTVLFPYG